MVRGLRSVAVRIESNLLATACTFEEIMSQIASAVARLVAVRTVVSLRSADTAKLVRRSNAVTAT